MDVSGKNFAIDKNVSGKVTLTFDKPVPWDQVLDLILRMNQLGLVYEGEIVRIATLSTLEQESARKQAKLAADQKLEEQQKALEPLNTEYIPVNYANASADILPHIQPLLSEGRGTVTVDTRNNQIIIKDVPSVRELIRETIERIDKVTPQVLIEARVVEATDNFTRDFGTQWQVSGTPTGIQDSLGGELGYLMAASNLPATQSGTLGINFSRLTGSTLEVTAVIAASESKGLLKIISSPKILTLDNTPATIKQGLSYPFNKLDADGNTTTEFKDIALELEVTPHVTPDNRISMDITVKNNEIGAVINNQISFTTKEANTQLLVNDGDTVIIGGIRKTRQNEGVTGVPGLKDIPLIGWMFKRKLVEDEMQELLIFITPRIVQLEQRNLG
jgi:type IV pilus assembly protein PilQ